MFQGPDTDPEVIDTLQEAIETWTEVTVELRNDRRDGSTFRNRLTVVPVSDQSGTIANWIGVQAAVEG